MINRPPLLKMTREREKEECFELTFPFGKTETILAGSGSAGVGVVVGMAVVEGDYIRQFQQHFTRCMFVRETFSLVLSTYSLAM